MSQKFNEIAFDKAKAEMEAYLKELYGKSDVNFSVASPYGQILEVQQQYHELGLLYLKNAIRQFDLSDTNSNNRNIIRSAAISAGHNPTRTISATGSLMLKMKVGVDVQKEIPGARVSIKNKTKLKNKTNGLEYIVNLGGADKYSYEATNDLQFYVSIVQGKSETTTFTSDGTINQSFQIDKSGVNDIENFNVEVTVNGANWMIRKSLYEILPNENACVIKTGFNGGVDLIFGNGSFGAIPPIGSIISVECITSDGSNGNIFRRTINDFEFMDDLVDGFGRSLDIANIFDIYIYTDINFGSDGESVSFTKNLLPLSNSNYVLSLPQHYTFNIKKLGVFSYVNAYERDGVIYIVVVPNVRLFKNKNSNYFTVSMEAFLLDAYERNKIDRFLTISGNIQLTKKRVIVTPKLSKYAINIFINTFSDEVVDNTNNQIYEAISNYMLDFQRTDRIPKKDIINVLADIKDIDSVDVNFICQKNEDYHASFLRKQKEKTANPFNSSTISLSDLPEMSDYNKDAIFGIDPLMGDIIFEEDEIPVIRGGFSDRYGIYYDDAIGKEFSMVNIIRKSKIDRKNIMKRS